MQWFHLKYMYLSAYLRSNLQYLDTSLFLKWLILATKKALVTHLQILFSFIFSFQDIFSKLIITEIVTIISLQRFRTHSWRRSLCIRWQGGQSILCEYLMSRNSFAPQTNNVCFFRCHYRVMIQFADEGEASNK